MELLTRLEPFHWALLGVGVLSLLALWVAMSARAGATNAEIEAARVRSELRPIGARLSELRTGGGFQLELEDLRKEMSRLRHEVAALRSQPDPLLPASMPQAPNPDPREEEAARVSAPPPGKPVELQEGRIVSSRSLAAIGSLVAGRQLYLNDNVAIDHVAFEQWSAFFDFRGGKPYMRYRTANPAVVDWNETTGQGRLVQKGAAEAY